MKTTILFLLIFCIKLTAQDSLKANFTIFEGKVESFAKIANSGIPTVKDTMINQTRYFKFAKDNSIVEVAWQLNNEDEQLTFVDYTIEKVYESESKNINTGITSEYTNFLCFDAESYPLLIMVDKKLNHIYLYYFWNNTNKVFKKSEKIKVYGS